MRFVMCQGASACLDQSVVELDGCKSQKQKGPNACFPEWDGGTRHGEALPRGHVKQSAPPVYDRLVIIHTGGVCVQ